MSFLTRIDLKRTMELYRKQKEQKLQQKGIVIWFTGLSGAGKTTLATNLEKRLLDAGFYTVLLDGDILRNGLNAGLGFTDADRFENIRRAAETAKLFAQNGVVTLCSFITPTEVLRNQVRLLLEHEQYEEIFVKCSIETCERRDVKGLYKKVRDGGLSHFTGISSSFEIPIKPTITVDTEVSTVTECIEIIYSKIITKILF